MSDETEQPVPTVRSRLAGALSDQRVAVHMANGALQLGGEVVTDLDTQAPPGKRLVISGT